MATASIGQVEERAQPCGSCTYREGAYMPLVTKINGLLHSFYCCSVAHNNRQPLLLRPSPAAIGNYLHPTCLSSSCSIMMAGLPNDSYCNMLGQCLNRRC
jgi:hypothetical protein